MNKGFWEKLKKPIFALAPMHDVTDAAFRHLIADIAKPDILFTEFVAVDGLVHSASREKMIQHYLRYDEIERPLVAQIWGSNPQYFYESAQLIESLGFDGIDINMGCPDKQVVKLGGGAALMQNPSLAIEIIKATQGGTTLPISIKTRIGFNEIDLSFLQKVSDMMPVAITIHGRTKKEMSSVPTHWDVIARITPEIQEKGILVLGNGDISSYQDAEEKVKLSGVDGVMIGRGVFGNPWIFLKEAKRVSLRDKLMVLQHHLELFEKTFRGTKNFSVIKKHVRGYVHGFDGAKEIRNEIVNSKTAEEMKGAIERAIASNR
ncbi:MAG: tRNA-dihydrouridine synthase [Candidatus Paceibacterota bacterium]